MRASVPTAPGEATDDSGPANQPADPEPDQPPSPSQPLSLDLIDADCRLPDAARRELVQCAEAALAELGRAGEVRVRLVGDDEMARLHSQYKNDPTTTDVLTFDHGANAAAPFDVDIVVCVDEASRQADARGHALTHELLLYILHGALHCSGYDDVTEEQSAAMHAREDEILRAIGVGAVYGNDSGGAS